MLQSLRDDVRYACRSMAHGPGFFLTAVLALALGIGANTAIFSVINTVILNPIPFANPDELVWFLQGNRQSGFGRVSPPDFQDWRAQQSSFEAIGAARFENFNIADSDQPERVRASLVSWELFPLLRMRPIRGRAFRSEDEQPANSRVVVMAYGLWERRYGREESVLGRRIRINGELYTVVGIMPRGFEFPNSGLSGSELWAPLTMQGRDLADAARMRRELMVFGRRKKDAALETARAEMDTVAGRIAAAHPATNTKIGVMVASLREELGSGNREMLFPLLAAVGLVLLIACANVANLLLARSSARRREIAIRAAVGATRSRIVAQLLTESVLLASAAAVLGLGIAHFARGLLSTLVPTIIIGKRDLTLDGPVLAFAVALALAAAVLFGLVPALDASRVDLRSAMGEGGRTSWADRSRARARSVLVVVEVTLCMTLLTGSALLIRRFGEILSAAPGFQADHLLTMRLTLPQKKYTTDAALLAFHDNLLEKIAAIPGVRSVAATNAGPLRDPQDRQFYIAGQPRPEPGRASSASFHAVSAGYFENLGIALHAGRGFLATDRGGAPIAILNAAAAKRFFRNQNPVGNSIVILGGARPGEGEGMAQIVGIAGDIRQFGLLSEPEPQIYVPFAQSPGPRLDLLVRTRVEPASITAAIRQATASLDKDQPVYNVATMDELLAESVREPRFQMLLIGSLAGVALAISLIGIAGVVSYVVSLRRREVAVRMALGGDRGDVVWLFLRYGFALATIGVMAGTALSLMLGKLLSRWVFGVHATDPVAFAAAALVLGAATIAASFVPAYRAARIDPMGVLRHE
jgi:putative ABC transport system permease protein